jgi:DNA-directed RNA polymerase specialized sigma24 family protein
VGISLPASIKGGASDPRESASSAVRLTTLFTLYHDRLVRALRARLGRYDWHLAEDLAGETWVRAVASIELCRAADDRAFGWLMSLAQCAMADHYRLARNTRELATDFTGPRAYSLPKEWAAEDHALARLTVLIRLADEEPAPAAVAA